MFDTPGAKAKSGNNAQTKTNPVKHIIKASATLILTALGVFGSVHLRDSGRVSEMPFVLLVIICIFVGTLVAFAHRIESFNLRELSVKLREVHETERSVKNLALAVLDVLEKSEHSLVLESFDEGAYKESVETLRNLAR